MADVGYSHPELVKRWELFVGECWKRSWNPVITSSSRSYAQQAEWYRLDRLGLWPTGPVANPNQFWGMTPWGWPAYGSLHMIQQDGYSHALDMVVYGPTVAGWHAVAWQCGLGFPEPGENWHAQWWGNDGIYPLEEDMFSAETLRDAISSRRDGSVGSARVSNGAVQIRLGDDPTQPGLDQWWDVADVAEFIHRHMKHQDTGI
jgi:hypothetical protein